MAMSRTEYGESVSKYTLRVLRRAAKGKDARGGASQNVKQEMGETPTAPPRL